MGQSAQHFLVYGDPSDIAILCDKIAAIACTGCVKDKYRPVTMEGMKQLANLTFVLLRCKNQETHYAIGEVRRNVALISKLFLNVSDTPLSNTHGTFLGPYYSSTSTDSLRMKLTKLANSLIEEPSDNADAQSVIRNIEEWADGLYESTKKLLLAAISVKSHFTIDMIHWITGLTQILLVVSSAPACDAHSQEELRKHARGLMATLIWISDDEESVVFVENFQLTEALFKAAMDARNRGYVEISNEIVESLMSWSFKGGRYMTRWGVLETGLRACATFALMGNDRNVDSLMAEIRVRVQGDRAPEPEVLARAAREIRECADTLPGRGHWSSSIEIAISESDHSTLSPLLYEIADILSPVTP